MARYSFRDKLAADASREAAEVARLHREVAVIDAANAQIKAKRKIDAAAIADVPAAFNALSAESRAHVAMAAVYRTGIRPATVPR